MKNKVLSVFLILTMVFSLVGIYGGGMTVSAAASGTGYYKVTASSGLCLRSGAGTSYSKLTTLPNGTVVNVTSVSSNWGKTTYNGKTGWISLDYAVKTTQPADASNVNVVGALAELRVKFPDGKYWNHVGSSSKNLDGYTSSPCPDGHNGMCNGQCAGFAAKLGVDIFGTSASSWGKSYSSTSWSDIKSKLYIGDIIRYNGSHSIVITGFTGSDLYIADCNWNYHCRISWDRFFSTSKYIKTVNYVYHNPSNKFKTNDSTLYLQGDFSDTIGKVTVKNSSTAYSGTLSTSNDKSCYSGVKYKNGAKVRASADSSAAVVGIPVDGDIFYCYDKKSVDGKTWYKIKLNTVSGWICGDNATFKASSSSTTASTTASAAASSVSSKTDETEKTTAATTAAAVKKVKVKVSTANVRKGAGKSYAKVTSVKKNKTYTYTSTKKVGSKTWYYIKVSSSKSGWICGTCVNVVKASTATTKATAKTTAKTSAKKLTITGGSVNVRKGAGTSYAKVTTVKKGATYTYTSTKKAGGKTWYYIKVSSSKSGWVRSDYVKLVK